MRRVQFILLLLVVGSWQPAPPEELTARVHLYWDALMEGDKAAALEFVAQDARNNFINRREPIMRGWALQSIEIKSESEAQVSVVVDRMVDGISIAKAVISENWVLQGQEWKVAVMLVDPLELFRSMTRGTAKPDPKPLSGDVRVVPSTLKIWFLSARQEGKVGVRNERPERLSVTSVDYDAALFKLAATPEILESGDQAELKIEYLGEEIKKNLPSSLVLNFEYQGQPESIKIEVVYNFFSDGSRGLFGLTKEEADKLPRGVVPRPAIKLPGRQKPTTPPPG